LKKVYNVLLVDVSRTLFTLGRVKLFIIMILDWHPIPQFSILTVGRYINSQILFRSAAEPINAGLVTRKK
jgi:hypothetical protein